MALALTGALDVRIVTPQHPTTPWSKVWGNLHALWSSEEFKAAWFMVIHGLIPTNYRLAKIQRSTTNNCQHCVRVDTLIHRLTECSEGADIGGWTRSRIAIILRMDPKYILTDWTDRPSEFSLLATSEAPCNFVDPRPHNILPYTTLAPYIDHRLR